MAIERRRVIDQEKKHTRSSWEESSKLIMSPDESSKPRSDEFLSQLVSYLSVGLRFNFILFPSVHWEKRSPKFVDPLIQIDTFIMHAVSLLRDDCSFKKKRNITLHHRVLSRLTIERGQKNQFIS